MKRKLSFPRDVEDAILEYRKSRKADIGKMLFRDTAIVELLRKALIGVTPQAQLADRVMALERRLNRIKYECFYECVVDDESHSTNDA